MLIKSKKYNAQWSSLNKNKAKLAKKKCADLNRRNCTNQNVWCTGRDKVGRRVVTPLLRGGIVLVLCVYCTVLHILGHSACNTKQGTENCRAKKNQNKNYSSQTYRQHKSAALTWPPAWSRQSASRCLPSADPPSGSAPAAGPATGTDRSVGPATGTGWSGPAARCTTGWTSRRRSRRQPL